MAFQILRPGFSIPFRHCRTRETSGTWIGFLITLRSGRAKFQILQLSSTGRSGNLRNSSYFFHVKSDGLIEVWVCNGDGIVVLTLAWNGVIELQENVKACRETSNSSAASKLQIMSKFTKGVEPFASIAGEILCTVTYGEAGSELGIR